MEAQVCVFVFVEEVCVCVCDCIVAHVLTPVTFHLMLEIRQRQKGKFVSTEKMIHNKTE